MKNALILHLALYLFTLIACHSANNSTPQLVYPNDTANTSNNTDNHLIPNEATKVAPHLPFTFDSLTYFYFPIVQHIEKEDGTVAEVISSYKGRKSSKMGYINDRSLDNCHLDNLFIQGKNQTTPYLLTRDYLKIKNLRYLYALDTLHQVDRFIYRIIDTDTNQDQVLNNEDLSSLYISQTNGKQFQRITPTNEELLNWQVQAEDGVLFFRTIADTNKDGQFDSKDAIQLYTYNLLSTSAKPTLLFDNNTYQQLLH